MYYNTLRGMDSTGLAVLPIAKKAGEVLDMEVLKMPGPMWFLEEHKKYDKMYSWKNRLIMNHNRSATIGPKTAQYAQPYKFENITGTHNGTVSLFQLKDLENSDGAISDSKTIIEAIDLYGIESVIPKIEGAWALVWYDKRDDTINFLRNDERPLYYTFDEDRKQLYWSSEVEHLGSALNRSGVKRKADDKGQFRSHMLPVNSWHKWKIPEENGVFEEVIRVKVEGKPRPIYDYTSRGYGNSNFDYYSNTEWDHKSNSWVNKKDSSVAPFQGKKDNASSTSTDQNTTSTTGNSGTLIPADAAARIALLGADKFTLIYRDDETRTYYETNEGKFHRYWWEKHNTCWHHTSTIFPPAELRGVDVADLLNRGMVRVGHDRWDSVKPPREAPIDDKLEIIRFKGTAVVVTKVKPEVVTATPWTSFIWNKTSKDWNRYKQEVPPNLLPDTQLDLAGHCFKHTGKREKKVVYYKGYNNKLLTMKEFNEITHKGCVCCDRTPTWTDGRKGGVRVNFVSNEFFLCEYCGEDEKLLNDLKKTAQEGSNLKGKSLAIANDPLPAIH